MFPLQAEHLRCPIKGRLRTWRGEWRGRTMNSVPCRRGGKSGYTLTAAYSSSITVSFSTNGSAILVTDNHSPGKVSYMLPGQKNLTQSPFWNVDHFEMCEDIIYIVLSSLTYTQNLNFFRNVLWATNFYCKNTQMQKYWLMTHVHILKQVCLHTRNNLLQSMSRELQDTLFNLFSQNQPTFLFQNKDLKNKKGGKM